MKKTMIFALCLVATNGWNGWRWLVRFPILRLLHGHWFLRTYAAVYLLSAIIYRLFRHDEGEELAHVRRDVLPEAYAHTIIGLAPVLPLPFGDR